MNRREFVKAGAVFPLLGLPVFSLAATPLKKTKILQQEISILDDAKSIPHHYYSRVDEKTGKIKQCCHQLVKRTEIAEESVPHFMELLSKAAEEHKNLEYCEVPIFSVEVYLQGRKQGYNIPNVAIDPAYAERDSGCLQRKVQEVTYHDPTLRVVMYAPQFIKDFYGLDNLLADYQRFGFSFVWENMNRNTAK